MLPGEVIYQSSNLSARFVDGESDRVVICFPDLVHPVGFDQPGWAEGFLSKRNISAIYISVAKNDWFQSHDFFDAMRACRMHLGDGRPVATYGSSMGGYAAILSARALDAELCLAVSPQFSIDPASVPFERRYNEHAAQIGTFTHDLTQHAGKACAYVVAYDPTHRLDGRHLTLIEESYPVVRLPVYGTGHGVLPRLSRTNAREGLADMLRGECSVSDVRHQVRQERGKSATYLRRLRNKAHQRQHKNLFDFESAAREMGFNKLADKWQNEGVAERHRPKLVLHCGLPKTGTTSLQAYFFAHADKYRAAGIFYPTDGADKRDKNHAWFSKHLRASSVEYLQETLRICPEDCHTLLLSDESLFVELPGLSDDARAALSDALAGRDVEIVLVEREKIAWMRSFYLQSVQNRRPGPPTKTPSARNLWQTTRNYGSFFKLPYCEALLDFPAMRARLGEVFRARKVTVLDFESGKDIVPVFCQAMGWPYFGDGPALARNPSLSDEGAEILRQANGLKDGQARFIKTLLELPVDFDPATMRPQRVAKLVGQVRRFPWEKLQFAKNAPLDISPEGFETTLKSLRQKSEKLEALAKTD